VRDLADPVPTAVVVSAVDPDNVPIGALCGYTVRIAR
jgi:hypothetical protein